MIEKSGQIQASLVDPVDFHINVVGAVLGQLKADGRIDIGFVSGQHTAVIVIRSADPDRGYIRTIRIGVDRPDLHVVDGTGQYIRMREYVICSSYIIYFRSFIFSAQQFKAVKTGSIGAGDEGSDTRRSGHMCLI